MVAPTRRRIVSRDRRTDGGQFENITAVGNTKQLACVIPASVALDSRRLAGFRRRLSRGVWLFPSSCGGLSRFGRGFNRRLQFPLGLFCSAMMAMVQRLDAGGLIFHPQLSVAVFLALIFKVFRNRFRCHRQSMAEPATSKLSTLALC